jgi:hypothetical protein
MTAEDPDSPHDARQSLAELLAYAYQLAEQRIAEPAEDIISKLVHADVDGDTRSSMRGPSRSGSDWCVDSLKAGTQESFSSHS